MMKIETHGLVLSLQWSIYDYHRQKFEDTRNCDGKNNEANDIYYTRVRKTILSRLTIMSREAKKKQAVRDEQVSYLHVAAL